MSKLLLHSMFQQSPQFASELIPAIAGVNVKKLLFHRLRKLPQHGSVIIRSCLIICVQKVHPPLLRSPGLVGCDELTATASAQRTVDSSSKRLFVLTARGDKQLSLASHCSQENDAHNSMKMMNSPGLLYIHTLQSSKCSLQKALLKLHA